MTGGARGACVCAAQVVCDQLWTSYGVAAAPLYGEQEREERVDVMRRLLDGRVRIAVSTEMGARGLDLPGLTHVVNLDLPTDPSHYVHRAGRCGRAGVAGVVLSIVPPGRAFVVDKLTSALGVPLRDMHIKGGTLHSAPRRRRAAGGARARGGGASGAAGRAGRKPTQRERAEKADGATRSASKKRGYPKLPPGMRAGGTRRAGKV
jgi:superfamily II DNA/RNA helicase